MTVAKKSPKALKKTKTDLAPKELKEKAAGEVRGGGHLQQVKNDTRKGVISNFRV
jgi:hypothetical protein